MSERRTNMRRGCRAAGIAGILASYAAFTACIDPDSPLLQESAEGCDEFRPGEPVPSSLDVHPKVRAFMQAASDFAQNAEVVRSRVFDACAKVATDLGAPDTWSGIEDPGEAIANSSGTGACDAASEKVLAALEEAGRVDATVALVVSRGECHLDFEMQKSCEAECTANAVCDSGSVETRCEPGSLSVVCGGTCTRDAYCVGTVEVAAACSGRCEAECVGRCTGECIHEDGARTGPEVDCQGKCSATCEGSCKGRCRIEAEAGIVCGASSRCTGGCASEYTQPRCVSEFEPPRCEVDEDCLAACDAKVAAAAICDPPRVRVFADVAVRPELEPLVATLEANLPPLVEAANERGRLLLDAARRMGDAGSRLESKIDDLDGKSLACLGAASSEVGRQIGSVDVSIEASVEVTVETTGITE